MGVVAGFLVWSGRLRAAPRRWPWSSTWWATRWARRAANWWRWSTPCRRASRSDGPARRRARGDGPPTGPPPGPHRGPGSAGARAPTACCAEERARPQPFELDLDLCSTSAPAAATTTWPTPSTTAPWWPAGRRRSWPAVLRPARGPGRPPWPRRAGRRPRGCGGGRRPCASSARRWPSTWARSGCGVRRRPGWRGEARPGRPERRRSGPSSASGPTWATGGHLRRGRGHALGPAATWSAVSPLYETEPVGGPADQGPTSTWWSSCRTDRRPPPPAGRCRAARGGGRAGSAP